MVDDDSSECKYERRVRRFFSRANLGVEDVGCWLGEGLLWSKFADDEELWATDEGSGGDGEVGDKTGALIKERSFAGGGRTSSSGCALFS